MSVIVGGLELKDVAERGASFEVERRASEPEPPGSALAYQARLEPHALFACIDDEVPDGVTPFAHLGAKMTALCPGGAIRKRVLAEGKGARPSDGAHARIAYNAYEEYEAQPFDSSYARGGPFTFEVGASEALEGVDRAVRSMRVGERAHFLVEPRLAYRGGGLSRVKADAVVLFDIALLEVLRENPRPADARRDFKHVREECRLLNLRANDRFRLQDYEEAARVFRTAAGRLEDAQLEDYDEQIASNKLLFTYYSNLLVCNTILGKPELGCFYANQIYKLVKDGEVEATAKVYYNNSKCLRMLGNWDLAERRLRLALKLEPSNKEIKREFETLSDAKKKYQEDKKRLAAAFSKSS